MTNFLNVFEALDEFERNLIRERKVAVLKAARARGRKKASVKLSL
ncbi:recombinase family protein [Granulicella sp. dw_53]|nr:recombinase family protein [Granulicella sp. dw_53]